MNVVTDSPSSKHITMPDTKEVHDMNGLIKR